MHASLKPLAVPNISDTVYVTFYRLYLFLNNSKNKTFTARAVFWYRQRHGRQYRNCVGFESKCVTKCLTKLV